MKAVLPSSVACSVVTVYSIIVSHGVGLMVENPNFSRVNEACIVYSIGQRKPSFRPIEFALRLLHSVEFELCACWGVRKTTESV